ncbi:MAG: aminoglycoside phosphotransferase family protein [Planctomycetes bacterium]|nr:aminoglycoside phosphotransferase family protein [Planctomycetota bacterium]
MDHKPDAEPKVSPGAMSSPIVPGQGLSSQRDTSTTPLHESPFGAALEPVLRQVCEDRLSAINWFRTDWQRGGALTGYATWHDPAGPPVPVVAKLPVPPCERQWLTRLQRHEDITPRVYAEGEALGGYDMAWVVMERLPHGPLGHAWNGAEFDLIVQAIGRFYLAASHVPLEGEPVHKDYEKIFKAARENIRQRDVTNGQRWTQALKAAHRKLSDWLRVWNRRPIDGWCHGDLHPANAMTRAAPPHGPSLLLDFAQTHVGHWVEDAVYLEHVFWARRQRLGGRKLCSLIAHERKRLGLSVDPDWPRYAGIKRALLAMSVPANLTLDGDPLHVQAALEVLETEVAHA